MKCRLCEVEKDKLCKAHLIPESFYRFMYPDGKVDSKKPLIKVLSEVPYLVKDNIGIYDESILCAKCDNYLGQLDEYGKSILLDSNPVLIRNGEIEIFSILNVDVAKLKLFFLSVLWRCSISKRSEVKHVFVGLKFENQLRDMLLSLNAGDVDDFSIVIHRYNYLTAENHFKQLLILPTRFKLEGINYFQVYFSNGYKVLIKVDGRPQHLKILPLSLQQNKPVYVFRDEYFENTPAFNKIQEKISTFKRIGT